MTHIGFHIVAYIRGIMIERLGAMTDVIMLTDIKVNIGICMVGARRVAII
jgi:hypothetical protein